MSEPRWLENDLVLDVHVKLLAVFGEPDGVRDTGLLESALARPLVRFGYGETDLSTLAAAYGFAIAKSHPFVDGNKRTALASMIVFLGLNGIDLDAPQEEAAAIVFGLAAGEIAEDVLAGWIAARTAPLFAPGIVP